MNRTTTVIAALIAAAGLSTMVYAVPEQRAMAWGGFGGFGGCGGFSGCGFGCGGWGGCGGGFFGGCGFGCGGFFIHKHIIQTIDQVNNCTNKETHVTPPPPPPCENKCTGDDQNPTYNQDQNQQAGGNDQAQNNNKVVCVNTATNTAGHGFGADGAEISGDGSGQTG
jgi:hypothetical protein